MGKTDDGVGNRSERGLWLRRRARYVQRRGGPARSGGMWWYLGLLGGETELWRGTKGFRGFTTTDDAKQEELLYAQCARDST